jgi:hypothetical protein
MNNIAGMFLHDFEEEFSFWVLVFIFEEHNMKNIIGSSLQGLMFYLNVVKNLVSYYLPDIDSYFV